MTLFRLTSNVLVQDAVIDPATVDRVAWGDIAAAPAADVARIGHVVNWFSKDSEAASIQAATARTMRTAGRDCNAGLALRLIACVADGETAAIPDDFQASGPLSRTVLDVTRFKVARRLPLLFDVLQSGAEAADPAGFLVFTNADICVQPHFYRSIQLLLSRGIDCLIVNRRTVGPLSAYGVSPELAMIETGQRHPGLDCFVFPVAWVAEFARSDACLGAGYVMRSLLYNLVARSKRMLILRDAHLTYHFGDDQDWAAEEFKDYVVFNLNEAASVLSSLGRDEQSHRVLSAFCVAHHEPLRP